MAALCLFIMVAVWLGEVASRLKCKRDVDRIFDVTQRHRYWQPLSVPEPLLFEDERGKSQVTDESCLHAALRLENLFQYNYSRELTPEEQQQYNYWTIARGADAGQLWFLRVLGFAQLLDPVPLHIFGSRGRGACNLFSTITPEASYEMCVMLQEDGNLPQWIEDMSSIELSVFLPKLMARSILSSRFSVLVVPSPFCEGFNIPRSFQRLIHPSVKAFFEASRRLHQPADHPCRDLFKLTDCSRLANDLRRMMHQPDSPDVDVYAWCERLQRTQDGIMRSLCQVSRIRGRNYEKDMTELLRIVLLSDFLRDAGKIRKVLLRAASIILSGDLFDVFRRELETMKLPHKGDVSRARLTFDVAYMHWLRCRNWINFKASSRFAVYLTWDSSPQFRRDYQMCVLRRIMHKNLPTLFRAWRELDRLWDVDFEALPISPDGQLHVLKPYVEKQAELYDIIRKFIWTHFIPTVLVGFGNSSFAKKLETLFHGIRLEHFTHECAASFLGQIVAAMADYGTEHMWSRAERVHVDVLCGYFEDTPQECIDAILRSAFPAGVQADVDNAVFEDPDVAQKQSIDACVFEDAGATADCSVSSEDFLDVPPLNHILDNATKGLNAVLEDFERRVFLAKQLCRLIRRRDSRVKLLERCFGCQLGLRFHKTLKGFSGAVFDGRWATLAFSVAELKKVERIIRWGWNRHAYSHGLDEKDADSEESLTKLARDADEAITSVAFWAWLSMIEWVCAVLRKGTDWVESCSCHYDLLQSDVIDLVPDYITKSWRECPMKGMRAPELSNGDLGRVIQELFRVSLADFLVGLPPDLEDTVRRNLVKDFNAARTHICFYVSFKIFHFEELPCSVFQCAHGSFAVAVPALQMCVQADHSHTRIRALQTQPLLDHARAYIQGTADILAEDMVELCTFLAELRFTPTTERPGEGVHAFLHTRGVGRHNHSVHFQSYSVRSPEIHAIVEADSSAMAELAFCADFSYNFAAASASLGLSLHPSILALRKTADADDEEGKRSSHRFHRHVKHAEVIYHADAYMLYTAAAPTINMRPDEQPTPRAAIVDGGSSAGAVPSAAIDDGRSSSGAVSLAVVPSATSSTNSGTGVLARLMMQHAGVQELLERYKSQFVLSFLAEGGNMFSSVPIIKEIFVMHECMHARV